MVRTYPKANVMKMEQGIGEKYGSETKLSTNTGNIGDILQENIDGRKMKASKSPNAGLSVFR